MFPMDKIQYIFPKRIFNGGLNEKHYSLEITKNTKKLFLTQMVNIKPSFWPLYRKVFTVWFLVKNLKNSEVHNFLAPINRIATELVLKLYFCSNKFFLSNLNFLFYQKKNEKIQISFGWSGLPGLFFTKFFFKYNFLSDIYILFETCSKTRI